MIILSMCNGSLQAGNYLVTNIDGKVVGFCNFVVKSRICGDASLLFSGLRETSLKKLRCKDRAMLSGSVRNLEVVELFNIARVVMYGCYRNQVDLVCYVEA